MSSLWLSMVASDTNKTGTLRSMQFSLLAKAKRGKTRQTKGREDDGGNSDMTRQQGAEGTSCALLLLAIAFVLGVAVGFVIRMVIG